jgi:hypothetical protein
MTPSSLDLTKASTLHTLGLYSSEEEDACKSLMWKQKEMIATYP